MPAPGSIYGSIGAGLSGLANALAGIQAQKEEQKRYGADQERQAMRDKLEADRFAEQQSQFQQNFLQQGEQNALTRMNEAEQREARRMAIMAAEAARVGSTTPDVRQQLQGHLSPYAGMFDEAGAVRKTPQEARQAVDWQREDKEKADIEAYIASLPPELQAFARVPSSARLPTAPSYTRTVGGAQEFTQVPVGPGSVTREGPPQATPLAPERPLGTRDFFELQQGLVGQIFQALVPEKPSDAVYQMALVGDPTQKAAAQAQIQKYDSFQKNPSAFFELANAMASQQTGRSFAEPPPPLAPTPQDQVDLTLVNRFRKDPGFEEALGKVVYRIATAGTAKAEEDLNTAIAAGKMPAQWVPAFRAAIDVAKRRAADQGPQPTPFRIGQ